MSKRFCGFSSVLLTFLMVAGFVLTGCNKASDDFPAISFPEDISAESSAPSTNTTKVPDKVISKITVASPYSDPTIQYLAKLYYCKTHDMMGENTGATISLDYLDRIDTDFIVSSVLTPVEGASTENIRQWNNDGNAPDIFLTAQVEDLKDNSYIAPLNDRLSDSTLLTTGNLFWGAVDRNMYDGILYAVPYYSSVMMIYGNAEFTPSTGKIAFKYDKVQFEEYLDSIKKEYSCIPLSTGYDLVPYVASAFYDGRKCSFMLYNESKSNRTGTVMVISSALEYFTSLYNKQLTANYTAEGSNPVFSRNAGLWMASSSEITNWSTYYPAGIYVVSLPGYDTDASVIPMTTMYSLCINKNSGNIDFASDFAAFMALDTDARLLTQRLEFINGFLPSVKNADVWSYTTSDPLFGQAATFYYQTLDNAVYCPSANDKLYTNVYDYLSTYSGGEFNGEACYGNP